MGNKKYKSEFFEGEIGPSITQEEYEKFNSPYYTSQEVFARLEGWSKQAMNILAKNDNKQATADAQLVLDRIREVRRFLKEDGEYPFKYTIALKAIELGIAVMKAHVRPHESNATAGRKSKKGRDEARKKRTPKLTEETANKMLDELHREHPTWSKTSLYHGVAEQTGINYDHLRKRITKHDPTKN